MSDIYTEIGHPIFMEKMYLKKRTLDFYILFFFLISAAGWLWEAAIYLVTEQALINRGAFYGPYLPVYGVGALLLWLVLQRFHRKRLLTLGLSAVLCSVLEYATGAFLEWRWGMRWWDYSGHFMNINGHICLLSVICFGLGGMMLNCYMMPYYMRLYHRIGAKRRRILCAVLSVFFVVDLICCLVDPHTGSGVTS